MSNKSNFIFYFYVKTNETFEKCKYHFEIEEIEMNRLIDSLKITEDLICLSTFLLIIHRLKFNGQSIEMNFNQYLLNIQIENCTFKQILQNIQLEQMKSIRYSKEHSSIQLNIRHKYSYEYKLISFNDTLIQSYQYLLKSLIDIPNLFDLTYEELVSLPLVSSNARSLNGPLNHFQYDSIYEYFQEIVHKYSEKICLKNSANEMLTYKECFDAVENLSSILQSKYQIRKGTIIGLWMNSSFEYIICLLTCLKLESIFVPLDVQYPNERLDFIQKQSKIQLILTNHQNTFNSILTIKINFKEKTSLQIEESFNERNDFPIETEMKSGYIIFTSGSSGTPKGIFIDQRTLLNTILSQIQIFQITSDDILVQYASICFDASLSEIFLSLFFNHQYNE